MSTAEVSGVGTARDRARTQLVDVATALLVERGPDAVTTRAVATAAGVQAPTLYRLFGDKDGLLDAVAEDAYRRYVDGKTIDPATDPLTEFRAGWDLHIGFGLANPGVVVLMTDPRRAARSSAVAHGQSVLLARVRRLAAAGLLRVSERRAVDLTHAAATGVLLTLIGTPEAERDLTLADAAYEAVLAALVRDTPAMPEPGPVGAAVALRASVDDLDALSPAERSMLAEWLDRVATG